MALSLEALKKLDELVQRALDLPPETRSTWIDALPPEDAALAAILRAQLASHDASRIETAQFPGVLPRFDASAAAAAIPEPSAGAVVGPYRLVRLLGEGGMSSVWLARDDGLRRDVALKLPHRHLLDRGLAERMARERDILAALSHDHIARLYDAGVDAHGRPYLALEHVAGEPIDAYCATHRVDLDGRVRLLAQAARAVAHAHASLVVHRDLKPANILVADADGIARVKLLDFGVGKILESDVHGDDLTQVLGRALTPDYASPEQLLDRPVTTATDIYSLGVLLYQGVTGEKPYRLPRGSAAALADSLAHADIERPSRRALSGPHRTDAKRISGDLDAIILKAMKPDPAERYATASALAEDLERLLARQPVLAQPDHWTYRLRLFSRRHKLALGAGLAVAFALLLGSGVALWQAWEARHEATKARAVKDFMVDLIRAGGEQEDTLRRKRSLGDVLAEAARKLPATLDPEIRSELQYTLGQLLQDMLLSEAAREVRLARVQDLEARGRPLVERMSAKVDLAYSMTGTPDKQQALALFDEAIRELDGPAGNSREAKYALMTAYSHRSKMKVTLFAGVGAVADAQRAVSIGEANFTGHELVYALSSLGSAHAATGDLVAAEAAYERALPIAMALPGKQAASESAVRTHLGQALYRARFYGRSEAHFKRALELTEKSHGRDSFHWALYSLAPGVIEGLRGNGERGAAYLEEAVQIFAALGKDINAEYASGARTFLAKVLLDRGLLEQARAHAEASYAPYRDVDRAAYVLPAIRARVALGEVMLAQGEHAAAEKLLAEAVALGEGKPTTKEGYEARRLRALARSRLGSGAAAQTELRAVIAADFGGPRFGAPRDWARITLAEVLIASGKRDEAAAEIAAVTKLLDGLDEDGRATSKTARLEVERLAGVLAGKR